MVRIHELVLEERCVGRDCGPKLRWLGYHLRHELLELSFCSQRHSPQVLLAGLQNFLEIRIGFACGCDGLVISA